MRRLLSVPVILALTAIPTGTQSAPTHDATFNLPEGALSGTVTFVVDARGRVSGTLVVPADGVDGRLGGSVKDGVWTIDIVYSMAGRDCEGRVTGTADVPADRQKIAGKIRIGGSCTQPEKPATFVFTRRSGGATR